MLENNNSGIPATMLVGPTGYTSYNGGFGGIGGDWGWIILLLLCANGGWGFGGGFGGYGNMALGYDFPWLMNGQQEISNHISDTARDQMLNDGITGIRANLGDISTQLCGGFAGVNATINGAQSALSQQLYTNEIASLNRSFAEQTANMQGFNGVQSGLCDIRYGAATNTRDIIEAQTRGTQAVLDKLCQLELDNYKRENDNLRSDLQFARGQASQVSQTSDIINGVYTRLAQCPVESTPVFGRQPIFTCAQNVAGGCGCSGNGFAFSA